MAGRRARPPINAWRRRFIARVLGVSTAVQLPVMALAADTLHTRGSTLFTAAMTAFAAVQLTNLVGLRPLLYWRDDERDPPWRTWLLEVPYAAFVTACVLAAIPAAAALLATGVWSLAAHRPWWPALHALWTPLYALAALGGVWSATAGRMLPELRVRELAITGLAPAFDGYRIVQLSDLHCGPYLPRWLLRRWCATATATGADLVALTGDYITTGAGYLDDVRLLAASLSARDGVVACMGNHDYFGVEDHVAKALADGGARVLRNEGTPLRRGDDTLWLAALDDRWTRRDDAAKALADAPAHTPVVMLAHDPASFPDLAKRGVALVLSGHTHAGQFALPLAGDRANLARVMYPYSAGVFREGASTLYVHRGLGTSGPPTRFATRPEVAVLVLRRA